MTPPTPPLEIEYPHRFYIGGEWVDPAGQGVFVRLKAHTEEAYATVAEAEAADAERAVAAARNAFDHGCWPHLTHAERSVWLRRIATGIREQALAFAAMWINQTGVTCGIALQGTLAAADRFDYYADLAATYPFVERHVPSAGGGAAYLVREPVGVVLAIIPWNAPMTVLSVKLAPALLAGCTIVLKASPEAPLEALLFAQICSRIGLPAGVLNVLTADRAVSEGMVRHPAIDKVSLTGSTAAGKRVASLCGERIARCTLELGGKSAAIVRADYDMGLVAASLAMSTPRISGQVCAALTRVIVPREKHRALLEALASAFSRIKVGDPFDAGTDLGPLATLRQLERVQHYVASGLSDGATLATGGGRPPDLDRGYFISPTLFGDVDPGMQIAREEIFGPVVTVIASESDAHALALANDSPFGLNSAIFTNDLEAAWSMARELRAGTVGHNGFRLDMNLSFGGFKQSGIGREGGVEGLLSYVESKTVLLAGILPAQA